ncbi:flagellar hook protein FlgE [Aquifex pyrophilus]
MLRSFFNAITGMDVSRFALDVTSDNLANANTVGFKRSRPVFQDMISQVIVGLNTTTGTVKTTTFGAGAVVDSTQKVWTIGNFKQTDITTDLAIEGKALFILKDPVNNQQFYTRDGRFRINREGYMINPNGLYLQGFKVDPVTGEVAGTQLENIRVETQIPPKATGKIYFNQPTNLNADVNPLNPENFDPKNPSTYHYRYTITIYDSLGKPYQADVFFIKTDTNTWTIKLLSDIDPNEDGPELSGEWTVTFDENGKIIYDGTDIVSEPSPDGRKRYYYLNPGNPENRNLIIPDSTPEGGTFPDADEWRIYVGESDVNIEVNNPIPISYITQHSAEFVVTMDQDGYARGELVDVYILSEDGVVVGVYSNGETLPMYRVALAQFTDPEELVKKGANLYASVKPPTVLLPGGANKIRSGMVELSNVDIAKEFINLITAQRTYQANARTVTVANTILEDTINLVR